jgi:hypothetical protein
MKKYDLLIIAAAAICTLAACSKAIEQDLSTDEPQVTEWTYISAQGSDATKASIDGTTAAFTWNTGDKIAVWSDGSYHVSEGLASTFNKKSSADFAFEGAINAGRANFAVFPASLVSGSSTSTATSLTLTLPASYNLSDIKGDLSPTPMIAANAQDGNLAFKSICALLRFTLVSVPKQTLYITFDFNGKKVQGEFSLTGVDLGEGLASFVGVQTSATNGDDDVITVENNNVFSTFQTNLVVNIPVPAGVASTGEYTDVTITTWDGEPGNGGHKINAITSPIKTSSNWIPTRLASRKREVYLPVYAITVSNGVNAGTKVVFAPGNLRAVLGAKPQTNKPGFASSWSFAPHQYDAIGNNMPADGGRTYSLNSLQGPVIGDVIDLFAWVGGDATGYTGDYADEKYKYGILYPSGTNLNNFTGTTDNYSGLLSDWGHNEISDAFGTYPSDTWRVLTKNEWYKVIFNRGGWRLRATLMTNGPTSTLVAYGYIIAPDQYTHPTGVHAFNNATTTTSSSYNNSLCSDNVYTLEEWEKLEGAGCVFLPLTNLRTKGSNSETIKPGDAWYWSSDANTGNNAAAFAFNEIAAGASQLNASTNTMQNAKSCARKNGAAVRLVRVVNDK